MRGLDSVNGSITLLLCARLDNLALLGAASRAIAREHLASEESAGLVELATVETCSNLIRHGHPDEPHHTFAVDLVAETDRLRIVIRDEGPEFSFDSRPMPAVDGELDDLPEGGFGIALVHASMDAVEHHREDRVNVITLVKRRSG
jgi:serine/threonine-protein kinase RsbW